MLSKPEKPQTCTNAHRHGAHESVTIKFHSLIYFTSFFVLHGNYIMEKINHIWKWCQPENTVGTLSWQKETAIKPNFYHKFHMMYVVQPTSHEFIHLGFIIQRHLSVVWPLNPSPWAFYKKDDYKTIPGCFTMSGRFPFKTWKYFFSTLKRKKKEMLLF